MTTVEFTESILKAKSNYVQRLVSDSHARNTWLSTHRRAGKDTAFIFEMLKIAYSETNKRIVVFANSSVMAKAIINDLKDWIMKSPVMENLLTSDDDGFWSFLTGTTISVLVCKGYAYSLRGSVADYVFLSEAQSFEDNDWRVLIPIMHGDKARRDSMRCYINGTSCGRDNFFDKKISAGSTEDDLIIRVPITENQDFTSEGIWQEEKSLMDPRCWSTEYLLEEFKKPTPSTPTYLFDIKLDLDYDFMKDTSIAKVVVNSYEKSPPDITKYPFTASVKKNKVWFVVDLEKRAKLLDTLTEKEKNKIILAVTETLKKTLDTAVFLNEKPGYPRVDFTTL